MPVPADAHLSIAHSASDATIDLPAMVPATSVLDRSISVLLTSILLGLLLILQGCSQRSVSASPASISAYCATNGKHPGIREFVSIACLEKNIDIIQWVATADLRQEFNLLTPTTLTYDGFRAIVVGNASEWIPADRLDAFRPFWESVGIDPRSTPEVVVRKFIYLLTNETSSVSFDAKNGGLTVYVGDSYERMHSRTWVSTRCFHNFCFPIRIDLSIYL